MTPDTKKSILPYLVAYVYEAGKPIEKAFAFAWHHWDACEIARQEAPPRTNDFQLYGEDEIYKTTGRSFLSDFLVLSAIGEIPLTEKKRRKAMAMFEKNTGRTSTVSPNPL